MDSKPALSSRIEPLEARIAPAFGAVINLGDLHGGEGFKVSGVENYDHAGGSVSNAGDMNADGIADFAVLATGANREYGATYVVFGKSSGFPRDVPLSGLDGTNGFTINGFVGGAAATQVRGAGDVNGDGVSDLILGAGGASEGGFHRGAAYVIFGKNTPFAPSFSLSALEGANGFKVTGTANGDQVGHAVSGAGDINGDGFDEIVVGSYGANAAYVVYGKASGFAPSLSVSELDGTNGFKLSSPESSLAGLGVSNAGDVNNDGFDDFIVGDGVGFYVVFGQAASFGANVDLSSLEGTNGFKITGLDDYYRPAPNSAQSSAGDVNGDGFDDIVVGNGGADEGGSSGSDRGAVHVIFGKAGGFSASLALTALDGTNGFKLSGGSYDFKLGSEVSAAGDINGDGLADIIAGSREGVAYVLMGKGGGFAASTPVSALDGRNGFRIYGTEQDLSSAGQSVSGAGDVNGDGFADVLVGAVDAYSGGIHRGAAYVIFGKDTSGEPQRGDVTISKSGKSAYFTDVDGDKVTVKTSEGKFEARLFDLRVEGLGAQLEGLDLGYLNFAKTNLSFTAQPQNLDGAPGKEGNGLVNVGAINAKGVDLGTVKSKGDVGQIDAGDYNDAKPAVKMLSLGSLGALGKRTQEISSGDLLHSHFERALGKVKLKGDLGSNAPSDGVTITVTGVLGPATRKQSVAIASLTVGGNVSHAHILAGYDSTVEPVYPDAGVGAVLVKGNWSASHLVAGVSDPTGDGFGRNDVLIPGGSAEIIARIASVTIKGAATGSAAAGDHFGITAQEIGQATIAGAKLDLDGTADLLLDPTNNDFRLVEVPQSAM